MTTGPTVPRTRAELAAMIDHTVLAPEATAADVRAACREGRELGVCAVCVSPMMVATAGAELAACALQVAAVVGFPSGAHTSPTKALEAKTAVADGAHELDMVIDLGSALAGDWNQVQVDIAAVRAAVPEATLKVIVEAGLLERGQLIRACNAAETAGAQFVKTSTGFHPCGGATVADVHTMAETVGPRLGVKASGGIRSARAALELVSAGATRLGLSGSATVLDELRPTSRGGCGRR